MYENENTPETEIESGAEDFEASPEPDTETESETAEGGEGDKPEQSEAEKPFHEHPRFKELVEQKNEALAASKALQDKYAAMEQRLNQMAQANQPKVEAKIHPMVEKLKGIDPEFAEAFETVMKQAELAPRLQQQYQEQQRQQAVTQAINHINSLHESNKVPTELRSMINDQIDVLVRRGEVKDIAGITSAFTRINSDYNKFLDTVKRSERESYVQAKKLDASKPTSQPKGKATSSAPKQQTWSKDPEVARQQVVSRYLKTAKADADSIS